MSFPRIRRDLTRLGLGAIQITSKAKNARKYAKHVSAIDTLIEDSQIEVLRALKERRVSLDQLVDASRRHELEGRSVIVSIAKRENLWEAIDKALPLMGKSDETRKRYKQTARTMKKKAVRHLPEKATVGDLSAVNWKALREEWGNSASDWMHVRRFISAFLTKHLRDVYHPYRREVVSMIPTEAEVGRVPDLSPETFWKIVDAAPEYVRPAYVTLVLTGMRRSEYLRCTKASLKPGILAVQVPGKKTEKSADTVYIEESMWPWIEAGIPSPLSYKWLRLHWVKACKAVGHEGLWLHDLRHALGQWATNEGLPESKVQDALRHASPLMTRRYTRQKSRGEVAGAVSKALRRNA